MKPIFTIIISVELLLLLGSVFQSINFHGFTAGYCLGAFGVLVSVFVGAVINKLDI